MAQYRIASDMLDIGKKGESVDDALLADLNIEALIAGGHLEVITSTSKNKNTDNTEEK
jgi:hypothetical protein